MTGLSAPDRNDSDQLTLFPPYWELASSRVLVLPVAGFNTLDRRWDRVQAETQGGCYVPQCWRGLAIILVLTSPIIWVV